MRRAFLCGKDKHSGKRYDHRKRWLENHLFALSDLFFVDLYGYAIMSNHYHLVVQTRPDQMLKVSVEEIAIRWCQLFPHRNKSSAQRIKNICEERDQISIYRHRLCDVSWLMRCLNEGLARRSNKEDGCTGRFWEGRFRSQLLLDESAVYTCMAYVDLNPIRAGIAQTPEQSAYTSIQYRINNHRIDEKIRPVNQSDKQLDLSLSMYLELVDETGRCIRDDKSGYILTKALPILTRLGINPSGYLQTMQDLSGLFCRAVGSVDQLGVLSELINLKWVKGQTIAKWLFG